MPAIAALDAPHPKKDVTQRNAGSSLLLKLPLELRIIIYEYVVQVDKPIRPQQNGRGSNKFIWDRDARSIWSDNNWIRYPYPGNKLIVTELARSCRMVYHELEAQPVFYRINNFEFECVVELYCFLAAITPDRRASIRRIILNDDSLYIFRGITRDRYYDMLMPLLHQCRDLRQLRLQVKSGGPFSLNGPDQTRLSAREHINRLSQWLGESPCSDVYSFLNIPGLEIALEYRIQSHPLVNYWERVVEDVTISIDRNGTRTEGKLAERVQQTFGTEITKIEEIMASGKTLSAKQWKAVKVTNEQLINSIGEAHLHFSGEDRVELKRLDSDIGAVSSRTRHRCNAANFSASSGRIERTVMKYDAEGLLAKDFCIRDIRSAGSKIECRICHCKYWWSSCSPRCEPTSWKPLHAVATNDGIYHLQYLYKKKLKLAAQDGRVMQSLPPPRDVTLITDAFREDKMHTKSWAPYQRTWKMLQAKYEARMKTLELEENEEEPQAQEKEEKKKKTSKRTARGRGKK